MIKNTKTPLLLTILLLAKGLFDLLAGCAMIAGTLFCMADGIPTVNHYVLLLQLFGVTENSGYLPLFLGGILLICALLTLGIVVKSSKYLLKTCFKAPTPKAGMLLIFLSLTAVIAAFFSFTSIPLIVIEGLGVLLAILSAVFLKRTFQS